MNGTDKGAFVPTRLTLLSMLLVSMLMLMGGAAVAPALPLIHAAFPDRDFAVSLIITLPSLAVGLTGFAVGSLADRFGKVRTLVVSLMVFTVCGAASFFLEDLDAILVMRFIVGVGIAGISAAVTALMAEYFTGAARIKVLSYQSAAMGVGVLVYLIGIPIMLLCILSMREPAHESPVDSDAVMHEPVRLADKRFIAVCYGAIFVCQTMSFLLPTRIPTFLEDSELPGYVSASMVGLFLGVHGVTNSVVSLMYRRIVTVIRPFFIMGLGFLIMGVGMVLLILSPTVITALTMMILVGVAIGMVCPAVSNTLAGQATSTTSGKIMGGYSTFLNFGQFAISLISVPLLFMVDGSIPSLFAIMGVLALIVGILFTSYCARDGRFKSAATGA